MWNEPKTRKSKYFARKSLLRLCEWLPNACVSKWRKTDMMNVIIMWIFKKTNSFTGVVLFMHEFFFWNIFLHLETASKYVYAKKYTWRRTRRRNNNKMCMRSIFKCVRAANFCLTTFCMREKFEMRQRIKTKQ